MEIVRKNRDLIEKIKAQDRTGTQVIELEIDDYINAEETLLAYSYGIDMQYMVEHLGGSPRGGGSFREVRKTNQDDEQISFEEFEAAFQDYQDEANLQTIND